MPPEDLRPAQLTIDFVVSTFTPLIRHRIRKFQVSEPVEDCFQQIIVDMITPSKTLGTSYLDRYDPARGTAQHYVLMYTMQQMMKLHARGKSRERLMPEPLPLESGGDEEDEASGTLKEAQVVAESMIPDPSAPWEKLDQQIRTPEDLREWLGGTRHGDCRSYSAAGEPRATVYMLELLIWGGLNVPDIATRLGVTAAEVHRRFKLLRKEPRLTALLK